MSEAELIAWITRVGGGVYATGLTVISGWSVQDKINIGFYDNPAVGKLLELTSAGVFTARTNASGQLTEANSTVTIARQLLLAKNGLHPTVAYMAEAMETVAVANNLMRRIVQVPLTEAGGAIAATVIVPGSGGAYYGVCRIKKIWAPTGTTDPANTWTINSEAGGAIVGPGTFSMNITAERNHWADAGAAGISGDGILCYNTTDDKDILISAADLAAVGTTYYVEVEYWYET